MERVCRHLTTISNSGKMAENSPYMIPVENIAGKGETARNLSHSVLQTDTADTHLKTGLVWETVNPFLHIYSF